MKPGLPANRRRDASRHGQRQDCRRTPVRSGFGPGWKVYGRMSPMVCAPWRDQASLAPLYWHRCQPLYEPSTLSALRTLDSAKPRDVVPPSIASLDTLWATFGIEPIPFFLRRTPTRFPASSPCATARKCSLDDRPTAAHFTSAAKYFRVLGVDLEQPRLRRRGHIGNPRAMARTQPRRIAKRCGGDPQIVRQLDHLAGRRPIYQSSASRPKRLSHSTNPLHKAKL